MSHAKEDVPFTIESDQREWLEKMAAAHDLPDASKALRVVLDHAMHEVADEAMLFDTIRCHHCG